MTGRTRARAADRDLLREELQALADLTAPTAIPPTVPGERPCVGCHLRMVCRARQIACLDLLAHVVGEPLPGTRRPTVALYAQLRALEVP